MRRGRGGSAILTLNRALDRDGFEFVIVGGVTAILEGASVATPDLDIVCRLDLEVKSRRS